MREHFISEAPGTAVSGTSQERQAQLYFAAGFQQSLQLVPWRQAQLEPPTALGRSLNVLGYSTHEALFPGILGQKQNLGTHRKSVSHTFAAALPTEGLGGAHGWDFLCSS